MRRLLLAFGVLIGLLAGPSAYAATNPQNILLLAGINCGGASAVLDFGSGAYCVPGRRGNNPSSIPGWSYSGSVSGTGATVRTALASNGTVVSFANGLPRITDLGLLIEESRINLQIFSVPTTAQWNTSISGTGVSPTVTYNFATAPDGTLTAARVQLDKGAGNTSSDFAQFFGPSTSAITGTYSGTLWVKTNDGSTKKVTLRDGTSASAMTVTGTWTRFSIVSSPSSLTESIGVRLRGGTENTSQTADLLVWGGQIEAGSFATSYIPTVAGSVTRAADALTLTYSPNGSAATVSYGTSSTASVSPTSPINLGASSGGAWVGNYIRKLVVTP